MNNDWPAEDYAIGSYIQAKVADSLLPNFTFASNDRVLDVGCGNGAYTRNILAQVPKGTVLGIDSSESMLNLAKEVSNDYPNFSIQKENVLSMAYQHEFDKVVSFWCLQWAQDIKTAFLNITKALKPGGKFFTIFPAGDDPYILGFYALRDSGKFPCLTHFKPPVNYKALEQLDKKLQDIPCQHIAVTLHHSSILLPSLDVYRKFVNGIAFYQGQIADNEIKRLNEAMVDWFADLCQGKEYRFDFTLYLVSGEA